MKYSKPTDRLEKTTYAPFSLPIDRPVALYYRQSSDAQIGNYSTSMQIEDLPAEFARMGWKRDQIISIDEDAGISGTTAIDERVGMSRLYDLVTTGKIGAVGCVNVDRLFRDQYLAQAGKFLEACAENRVIVVSPGTMPYAFHDPVYGDFHSRRFLDDCRAAGEFLKSHVIGRMYKAKLKKSLSGKWVGGGIPLGYAVAKEGNFVVFEPIAAVIREYFRLFVGDFEGRVLALSKHIEANGPYLPLDDPAVIKLARDMEINFYVAKNIKPKSGGHYFLTVGGLRHIFTNAMYLGYWVVKNSVMVATDRQSGEMLIDSETGKLIPIVTHEALIDHNTWFKAFNYLSRIDIFGENNPDFCPHHVTRPKTVSPKKEDRPILDGLLYFEHPITGELRRTAVSHDERKNVMYVASYSTNTNQKQLWSKKVSLVNDAVIERIRFALASTARRNKAADAIENDRNEYETERTNLIKHIEHDDRNLRNLTAEIANEDNPEIRRYYKDQFAEILSDKQRLERKVVNLDKEATKPMNLQAFREKFYGWWTEWDNLSIDERKTVVKLLLDRVVAHIDGSNFVLTLVFNDGCTDTAIVPRWHGGWTNEENEALKELVAVGADQVEVCQAFPEKTWNAIHHHMRYQNLGVGYLAMQDKPIRKNETFEEFKDRAPTPTSDKHCSQPYESESRGATLNLAALLNNIPASIALKIGV